MQDILSRFFLGGRWRNNQRKSNSVWYNTSHLKIIALICCARRSPKVTLITVSCQHCGVKTSAVTPSFYYVFNISLSCNINIPSFIGNLWRVLLLGNHLKLQMWVFLHHLSKLVPMRIGRGRNAFLALFPRLFHFPTAFSVWACNTG